jgi:O-antigen/teichoic acid export membrane protein
MTGRRALGDLALVSGGKALSLGATFACGVLVARAAGAAEYGFFAAALSLALILDALIGSPLDFSAVRFGAELRDDPARVDRLQGAAFRLKLLAGLVLVALALSFGRPLAALVFGDARRSLLAATAMLAALCLLLARGTAAHLQIHERFTLFAALDTLQGLLRILALAALALAGTRTAEPFLGAWGAGAAGAFLVAAAVVPQPYLRAGWPDRKDARAIATHSGAVAGVVALGTLTGRIDVLILSAVRPGQEAGCYAAAVHVALLVSLLAGYASVIAQPRVIPMARGGRLPALLAGNAIAAAALSVLMVPAALFAVPRLLPFLFGPGFACAVPVLQILLVGSCADMFFMPVPMTYTLQVRPARALLGEAVITLLFVAAAGGTARAGPLQMAALATGARVLKLVLYWGIAWPSASAR